MMQPAKHPARGNAALTFDRANLGRILAAQRLLLPVSLPKISFPNNFAVTMM